VAAAPIGVAVLLHGLSDSPYSLLSTAKALAGAGYNVVVPRMPGHGFAVGGLQQARSEDWAAATRIAVRRAMQLPASDRSMIIAGYSNGGLLAVDFALRCAEVGLQCPDKLVLISPAIAVTNLASVANLHGFVSWIPYFEKFAWISILPEIDPFKFTSFPKRAAWEIRSISSRVAGLLDDSAHVAMLPPILTFQSIVDSTVGSIAVSDTLYRKLPENGSKLIAYDVNRNHAAAQLMNTRPDDTLGLLSSPSPLRYDITLLQNRDGFGPDVETVTMPAGSIEPQTVATGLKWPADVYSLSHIALPFRADDPIYGDGRFNRDSEFHFVLGALTPRGERGVLTLPAEFFLRARYNPFHRYQTDEMIRWLRAE
jgi:pimeloyl-ACP methyl ester carboxylesterase